MVRCVQHMERLDVLHVLQQFFLGRNFIVHTVFQVLGLLHGARRPCGDEPLIGDGAVALGAPLHVAVTVLVGLPVAGPVPLGPRGGLQSPDVFAQLGLFRLLALILRVFGLRIGGKVALHQRDALFLDGEGMIGDGIKKVAVVGDNDVALALTVQVGSHLLAASVVQVLVGSSISGKLVLSANSTASRSLVCSPPDRLSKGR